MSVRSSGAVIALLAAGCASCPCGAKPATAGSSDPAAPAPGLEPGAVAPPADGAPGAAQTPSALTEAAAPGASAEPAASLPEVLVESVGMHVGGGRNDEAEKAPFKRAIEAQFVEFRRCYVHVEQPGKGGTFGVDLFIDRDGGAPEVRQPRTGMSGDKFRSCVVGVFGGIQFERPRAGPTVVSYSLRFTVGGR
jgi:hypothetical protein